LGSEVGREELVEQVWPDSDADTGRHNLRQALYWLRNVLEPEETDQGTVLIASSAYVSLNPRTVSTDVARFCDYLTELDRRPEDGGADTVLQALRDGADLYNGHLLPGNYDDWILIERDRLAAGHLRLLTTLVSTLERAGDADGALYYALQTVVAEPTREDLCRTAMRLYSAVGQPAHALRLFRRLRHALSRDLGITPSSQTRAIASDIRRGKLISATVTCEDGPRTARQPKTITEQAVGSISSSVVSGAAAPLPNTSGKFYGRDSEIAELRELLLANPSRLVTLTGAGGSGKTRLAVELARGLRESFDRTLFIPLAQTGTTVGSVVAHDLYADVRATLGLSCSGEDSDTGVLRAQVASALRTGKTLMVLDNCEHLLTAAAEVVSSLLRDCPGLTCLVTSRSLLYIPGEQEYRVEPLAVPKKPGTPERLLEFPSVQLFVDRAQAASRPFRLTPRNADAVVALCRRLDGLPLAIELAAARAHALTPIEMLGQLDDRFRFLISRRNEAEPRHATLHAAIDWSYALLPEDLQRCFGRLSVFRGGWTLQAAAEVCEEPAAADVMQALVERSLVTADALERGEGFTRYRMLDSLREFGDSMLTAQDRKYMQAQHADYFDRFVSRANEEPAGPCAERWLDRFEAEHENLRAVLSSCTALDRRLRLAAGLWRFWVVRGFAREGYAWLTQLLDEASRGSEEVDAPVRAEALSRAGVLARRLGLYAEAGQHLQDAIAIRHSLGDRRGMAQTLAAMANLCHDRSQFARAKELFEDSLAIWRDLGDLAAVGAALNGLGRVAHAMNDLSVAWVHYSEAADIYRQIDDRASLAAAVANRGGIDFDRGFWGMAQAAFEDGLRLFEELQHVDQIAMLKHNIGETMLRAGNHHDAEMMLHQAVLALRETGDRVTLARALWSLGNIAAWNGGYERAARLYGAADGIRDESGATVQPVEQHLHEEDLLALRRHLPEGAYDLERRRGRYMSEEEAVRYATENRLDVSRLVD
jgi:predicted ATPase/DNA-binding SARP family transcriptional activator